MNHTMRKEAVQPIAPPLSVKVDHRCCYYLSSLFLFDFFDIGWGINYDPTIFSTTFRSAIVYNALGFTVSFRWQIVACGIRWNRVTTAFVRAFVLKAPTLPRLASELEEIFPSISKHGLWMRFWDVAVSEYTQYASMNNFFIEYGFGFS